MTRIDGASPLRPSDSRPAAANQPIAAERAFAERLPRKAADAELAGLVRAAQRQGLHGDELRAHVVRAHIDAEFGPMPESIAAEVQARFAEDPALHALLEQALASVEPGPATPP